MVSHFHHQCLAGGVGGELRRGIHGGEFLHVLTRAEGHGSTAMDDNSTDLVAGCGLAKLVPEPFDGCRVERIASVWTIDAELDDHDRPNTLRAFSLRTALIVSGLRPSSAICFIDSS